MALNVAIVMLSMMVSCTYAIDNGLGLRPPLGFRSFNAYYSADQAQMEAAVRLVCCRHAWSLQCGARHQYHSTDVLLLGSTKHCGCAATVLLLLLLQCSCIEHLFARRHVCSHSVRLLNSSAAPHMARCTAPCDTCRPALDGRHGGSL